MTGKRFAVFLILSFGLWQTTFGQAKISASLTKELEAAEAQMFAKMMQGDPVYMRDFVSDDFFSINADGGTVDKAQVIAGINGPKQKMFAASTVKLFDKKIIANGNLAIINGRARAYTKDTGTYIVEFLYTAVFEKQHGKWMYARWQGTISKDSPPPPPVPKD
jgi:hypothetical protein